MAQLHHRLRVLQKLQWAPTTMLCCLLEVSEEEVEVAIELMELMELMGEMRV